MTHSNFSLCSYDLFPVARNVKNFEVISEKLLLIGNEGTGNIQIINTEKKTVVFERYIKNDDDTKGSFRMLSISEIQVLVSHNIYNWRNRLPTTLYSLLFDTESNNWKCEIVDIGNPLTYYIEDSIRIVSNFREVTVVYFNSDDGEGWNRTVGCFYFRDNGVFEKIVIVDILLNINLLSHFDNRIFCFKRSTSHEYDSEGITIFNVETRKVEKVVKLVENYGILDLTLLKNEMVAVNENEVCFISLNKIVFVNIFGIMKLIVSCDHAIKSFLFIHQTQTLVFQNRNRFYSLVIQSEQFFPFYDPIPIIKGTSNVRSTPLIYGFPEIGLHPSKMEFKVKKRSVANTLMREIRNRCGNETGGACLVTICENHEDGEDDSGCYLHFWKYSTPFDMNKNTMMDRRESIEFLREMMTGSSKDHFISDQLFRIRYGCNETIVVEKLFMNV